MELGDVHREDMGRVGHLHPSGARLKAAGQLLGNQMPRSSQANPAHAKTQHRQQVRVSADSYPVLFDKCHDRDLDFIPIWTPGAESPASAKV